MLFCQQQTFVLVGITVSHVLLIKWLVHSTEWRNEALCHPGLITKMPPFTPLVYNILIMKENRGSSLTLLR